MEGSSCAIKAASHISYGLGPSSIAGANDEAQFAYLKVPGELTGRARKHCVQLTNEGPVPHAHAL